jgi:hypothetical protein
VFLKYTIMNKVSIVDTKTPWGVRLTEQGRDDTGAISVSNFRPTMAQEEPSEAEPKNEKFVMRMSLPFSF